MFVADSQLSCRIMYSSSKKCPFVFYMEWLITQLCIIGYYIWDGCVLCSLFPAFDCDMTLPSFSTVCRKVLRDLATGGRDSEKMKIKLEVVVQVSFELCVD